MPASAGALSMVEPLDLGLRDDADVVAAWLVHDAAAGAAAPARVFRLDRADCVQVANAVVSIAAADGGEAWPPSGAGIAGLCRRVPAVAAWGGHAAATSGKAAFLAALASALVLPDDDRSAGLAGRGPLTAEAALLRTALALAAAHVALRDGFEQAVAHARLEAMRELAYGAGHEINNPLANIATRAQALLVEETDPERRRRLSTIVDQSFRARDMIGGLMVFARPPKPLQESVEVGSLIVAAIEAVRPQAVARGIRLEYSPLPKPMTVWVDRAQVEEAVRMVLVNACEAVTAAGSVVVRVSCGSIEAGRWCVVSVEDDGPGMTLDQAKRACDPFYSGREAGRGAGMGLPKAWRLVESSGGDVSIDSRPGQGTRVSIRLPLPSDVGGLSAVA